MIAAEYVPPVVHNSPDATDAIALICTGIAIAAIMAALIWVSNRANQFWADREERATIAAEHVATKTRTYSDYWAGRAADVAAVEAAIARGDYNITIAALHRKPKNNARLAEFKKSRRSA